MKKTTKVAAPKAAQVLSKEMKQLIEIMIEKALKPAHKQLSDLQEKLKALKMAKDSAQKSKAPSNKNKKIPAKDLKAKA